MATHKRSYMWCISVLHGQEINGQCGRESCVGDVLWQALLGNSPVAMAAKAKQGLWCPIDPRSAAHVNPQKLDNLISGIPTQNSCYGNVFQDRFYFSSSASGAKEET